MRAKFKCNSVTTYESGSVTAHLKPVIGGSEENRSFWNYSPGGSLELNITNPNAVNFFQPGKEYYLDFNIVQFDEQTNDNIDPIEPAFLAIPIPNKKVVE